MDIMRFSIQFNDAWILKEARGQQERAEPMTPCTAIACRWGAACMIYRVGI